jgi:hypothetical protein
MARGQERASCVLEFHSTKYFRCPASIQKEVRICSCLADGSVEAAPMLSLLGHPIWRLSTFSSGATWTQNNWEPRKRHSKRGENGKSKRGACWPTVCLSMYSTTENIYYSQLSSVAILVQPEPVSHRIIQGKDCVLSLCAIVLRSPPPSHVYTYNCQRRSQLFCVHCTTTASRH